MLRPVCALLEKYDSEALARPACEHQAAPRNRAGRGLAYPAEAGPVVEIDHYEPLAVDHRIAAPSLETQGGGGASAAPPQSEPPLVGHRALFGAPFGTLLALPILFIQHREVF